MYARPFVHSFGDDFHMREAKRPKDLIVFRNWHIFFVFIVFGIPVFVIDLRLDLSGVLGEALDAVDIRRVAGETDRANGRDLQLEYFNISRGLDGDFLHDGCL